MIDLTKTFNKFYPRSQTVSKGVFLNKLAWTIEIIIALIGLLISSIIILKSQGAGTFDEATKVDPTLDDLLFGLIFAIVAIIELTKIPLATAVYFAAKLSWRLLFLIALLLVNISTFETIITGFERINRARTANIEKLYVQKASLEKKIFNIRSNIDEERLQEEINLLILRKNEIQQQINIIESNASNQRKLLQSESANQGIVEGFKRDLINAEVNIEKYNNRDIELRELRSQAKGIFNSNKKKLDNEISDNKIKLSKEMEKRDNLSNKLTEAQNIVSTGNINKINNIDQNRQKSLIPLNKEINQIDANLKIVMERKKKLSERGIETDEELNNLEEELKATIDEIDTKAPENQVFRVAKWFKGLYQENFEKKINDVEEKIAYLTNFKINPKQWIFFDKKLTETELKNIDQEILRLEEIKRDIIDLKEYENSRVKIKTIYADIPEGARVMAFWAWFGVLSGIISVVGTMLAFASLNLQDPRMHEIRQKKTVGWYGASYRFSKIFVLISRYIWGLIKRLKDPKIVEKPAGEKIVYHRVEVPKEVVQKELVYVPLPTNNPELLKKGKFSSNKEKTKK